MFKELGKYMIDVSKYVFTTILLSVLFADNINMSLYVVTAIAVSMVLLALGLGFIKDFSKGGKE